MEIIHRADREILRALVPHEFSDAQLRGCAFLLAAMTIDDLRAFCLALPHATEKMQWGDNLLFCVAGKMFAIVSLDAVPPTLMFKCSDEEFLALQEIEGVRPAPYLARAKWVQLDSVSAVPRNELQRLLSAAHGLIFAKLPKKTRMSLEAAPPRRARARRA